VRGKRVETPDEVVVEEYLAFEPAESLAGMLDIEAPSGDQLPELWHWIYLLERRPERDLGPDGHPVHGIPAPPGPGRRRMFAGGRVSTYRPLVLGRMATRTSRVASTQEKEGRTGPLTFVTVRNTFSQDGEVAIVDEQDIVYRTPDSTLAPSAPPAESPVVREPHLTLDVDTRLLFRFSALTYNAHRIHYDRDFVKEEGYTDLLVHGPLQALMMGELFRRNDVPLVGRQFSYRLVAPMVGPQTMTIAPGHDGVGTDAGVLSADGRVTARATLGDPA
jgi:3-methylfumaryl-CoA hydratase